MKFSDNRTLQTKKDNCNQSNEIFEKGLDTTIQYP